MDTALLHRAALALRRASHPFFLSGAGISAESGIPTFRGAAGGAQAFKAEGAAGAPLWTRFRAEELATPEAFKKDAAMVWDWYNWRKKLISEKKPNPAHTAAAELATLLPQLTSATQNVDGFHQVAGLESILEMHGNIFRTRCLACGAIAERREETTPATTCSTCGGTPLRPDVVWFGEALPRFIMDQIHDSLNLADAILVVGTSGSVYPAAGFAVEVRRRRGQVIEINVDESHRPYGTDIYLKGPAGEILPALVEGIKKV